MTDQIILVLDTETTGLKDPIGIVSIAWWEIDNQANILDTGVSYSGKVFTDIPISPSASGTHGLVQSDLEGAPVLEELPWPDSEVLLVCHNTAFDRPLVEEYLNIGAELCTLRLARKLLPDAPDHKLSTLEYYCELPSASKHEALPDIITTIDLLKYMVEGSGMSVTQLMEYNNKPTIFKTMPWGKHKGVLMKEVPKSYLTWLDKKDLDIDMRATVNKFLGRR